MKIDKLSTGLLVLRLTIGVLLLFHGISKLTKGVEGIKGMLSEHNLPPLIAYGVYFGEIIAPILIILGFRTRIGAILIVINMLFAIFLAHASKILTLNPHGGLAIELDLLYLMGAITLILTGGGKYTVTRNRKWD